MTVKMPQRTGSPMTGLAGIGVHVFSTVARVQRPHHSVAATSTREYVFILSTREYILIRRRSAKNKRLACTLTISFSDY